MNSNYKEQDNNSKMSKNHDNDDVDDIENQKETEYSTAQLEMMLIKARQKVMLLRNKYTFFATCTLVLTFLNFIKILGEEYEKQEKEIERVHSIHKSSTTRKGQHSPSKYVPNIRRCSKNQT